MGELLMGLEFEFHLDLDKLITNVEAVKPEALQRAMEHVGEVSASQTPIQEGRLVGSQKISVDGDTASISYEGPYARYQHEKLNLRHEHGNAKYLEGPLTSETGTAIDILANDVKKAL